jgi:hypothetical protein
VSFVWGTPVKYTDPSGHFIDEIGDSRPVISYMYAIPLILKIMASPTMTASATIAPTATATQIPNTSTPSPYPPTATGTTISGTPTISSTPSATPTSYIPSLNEVPYEPHCETKGLDYTNLTLDLVGIGLDLTPVGAVDDLKTIQRLYNVVEVGGDLLSLDFEGYNDWFSLGTDIAGFVVPVLPNVLDIGANVVHPLECVEPESN